MPIEHFQWIISLVVGVILLPLIWKVYDMVRSITADLYRKVEKVSDELNDHKRTNNEMHLKIIQQDIPNAMREVKDDIKEIKMMVLGLIERKEKR